MPGHHSQEFDSSGMRLRTWLYPASVQNHGDCLVQNLEVSPDGPGPYVFQIESQTAFKRWIATRGNLPQSGKPWRYIQTLQIAEIVALEIIEWMRPRPHQAHFTPHYVPELRQFIQTVAAEKSSDTGNPGIVDHFEKWPLAFVAGTQVFF